MAQSSPEASVIKAYWQPGCTSCLRMKEFLTEHGVPFVSINVLEDKDAFAELAMLGIRSVPILRRGKDCANGQVLREVARVAGIAWGGAQVLPAPELAARLTEIQTAAQRLFAQIPDDKLGRMLPSGLSLSLNCSIAEGALHSNKKVLVLYDNQPFGSNLQQVLCSNTPV